MKTMKNILIVGLLTIVLAAFIMGIKAFIWVFSTVLHYGLVAFVIALLIFLLFVRRSKTNKNNEK